MSERSLKLPLEIKRLAATFFEREANNQSLITITDCLMSPDMKRATVLFTVLPETKEAAALDFMRRKSGELRTYVMKNMRMRIIPFFEIEIDQGEKNRQLVENLLNKK